MVGARNPATNKHACNAPRPRRGAVIACTIAAGSAKNNGIDRVSAASPKTAPTTANRHGGQSATMARALSTKARRISGM